MSKVLVILGMHRSGTSLLANLIHESGIFLGESLMPSTTLNPKGYYEDMEIYELHDRILKENKLDYTVTADDKLKITNDHEKSMVQLLKDRSILDQWGWKEPRTCLFINTWHKLLIEEGHEPYYVLSYRPLEQVVDSLTRRDIVEINLHNKLFARWRKLKQYNRVIREKQLHYMESWRHHLSELKEFHKKNTENSAIIYSPEISIDFPKLVHLLENNWGFQLQEIAFDKIYNKDYYNTLPEINEYSDKNIQALQNYFMNNRLS